MTEPIRAAIQSAGEEAGAARERSMALEAILVNAPALGIDEAVAKFGAALTKTEVQIVKTLDPRELEALNSARAKLGRLGPALADNNNNVL